jgi:hypothetical protein
MKTVLKYLQEQEEMAWHNRLCYSQNYGMDTPKVGYEKEFKESVRDCEIVEELLKLVKEKETPAEQTPPCDYSLQKKTVLLIKKHCIPKRLYIDHGNDYVPDIFPSEGTICFVTLQGIPFKGQIFSSSKLMGWIGQRVLLKFTSDGRAIAFTSSGERIGVLTSYPLE